MTRKLAPRPSVPRGEVQRLRGRRILGLPVLVTCEHGGHHVPKEYSHLFEGAGKLLESHRGWDRGALDIATVLARELGAPLVAATTTRLLVDLNRSPGHPARFGVRVRGLPPDELLRIDRMHYWPYRELVRATFARLAEPDRSVLHVSMHSFTPVLRGARRRADIGILYDPSRRAERAMADAILSELLCRAPELTLRRNYPYRGSADSLVAALRREDQTGRYMGLEIEVNQRLARAPAALARIGRTLVDALESARWGRGAPS